MQLPTLRLLLKVQVSDHVSGQAMYTIPRRQRQFVSRVGVNKVNEQIYSPSQQHEHINPCASNTQPPSSTPHKMSHIHGSSVARRVGDHGTAHTSTFEPFQHKHTDGDNNYSSKQYDKESTFGKYNLHNNNGNDRNCSSDKVQWEQQQQQPYLSQGEKYRHWQKSNEEVEHQAHLASGIAAASLGPIPAPYNLYNGIDRHGWHVPHANSRDERRLQMQHTLQENALSTVEFIEGGEEDIELNGLPASEYHGQEGWTSIPTNSSLYNNIIARHALDSRARTNTWMLLSNHHHHHHHHRKEHNKEKMENSNDKKGHELYEIDQKNNYIKWKDQVVSELTRYVHKDFKVKENRSFTQIGDDNEENEEEEEEEEEEETLSASRRWHRQDFGEYSNTLEEETLSTMQESIAQPRSSYGLRKLYVDGLVGYQGIITRAEEVQISAELLRLLQHPSAAYIAEETRYCVNLYERELGIPNKDTLAFALSSVPTLQKVLYRFFLLGLIPSPPNVCQVSEMIGNFAGYPVHRKPESIGSYYGVLNLVATTVMYLQHTICPWFPRLHLNPRSLFVITEPCLSEYKIGYKLTHQPFHQFEYSTRVSKDYNIEIVFATVEPMHTCHLREAVQLTDYALQVQQKQLTEGQGMTRDNNNNLCRTISNDNNKNYFNDEWLSKLRDRMHAMECTNDSDPVSSLPFMNKGNSERQTVSDIENNKNSTTKFSDNTSSSIINGHELRERLIQEHLIGKHAVPFIINTDSTSNIETPSQLTECTINNQQTTLSDNDGAANKGKEAYSKNLTSSTSVTLSPARRRIAALKARYDVAEQLQTKLRPVSKEADSYHLIRGHSLRDKSEKL